MRQPDANRTGPHVAAQVASSWASLDAASRSADLANALSSQDRVFLASMREMQVVRDFVGTPENILGSATTKHGEIAEQVNVAIIRARDILLGRAPTATFEGVGRFATHRLPSGWCGYPVQVLQRTSQHIGWSIGVYLQPSRVCERWGRIPYPQRPVRPDSAAAPDRADRRAFGQEHGRDQRQARLAPAAYGQACGRPDRSWRDGLQGGPAGTYS